MTVARAVQLRRQWALSVAGPACEHYLIGPRDVSDPTAWRTEIGWPVFRMAH